MLSELGVSHTHWLEMIYKLLQHQRRLLPSLTANRKHAGSRPLSSDWAGQDYFAG